MTGWLIAARYWGKVDVRGPSECWPWLDAPDADGYGVMCVAGKNRKATHIALELSGRPRPGRASALHSCDNPPCQNPVHLRWGSQRENVEDREQRSRRRPPVGSLCAAALLNEGQIPEIRASREPRKALAERFGVSIHAIADVRNGRTWRHV